MEGGGDRRKGKAGKNLSNILKLLLHITNFFSKKVYISTVISEGAHFLVLPIILGVIIKNSTSRR